MKSRLAVFTLALFCAWAGNAFALSKEELKVQNDRISADYKIGRDKCASLSSNPKDICQAEAKGAEKVAKAELEAQHKPTPRNAQKALEAKANAAYSVAKEKCDDLAGNPKDVCMKEAKAVQTSAMADAPGTKVREVGTQKSAADVNDARKDATEDKRDANYKVAREKCDSLAGDAKDGCVNAAKAQYGMK